MHVETGQKTIAALYVEPGGVYYDLPGVEPWGLPDRDAREYDGPWSIIAHPPCARWCMLAGLVESRYGIKRGEDGGLFRRALSQVRAWGGVLEHPAHTLAWRRYDLLPPSLDGGWTPADFQGGWTCCVEQGHYGHRARKATWLYVCGVKTLPSLTWGKLEATAWVSNADMEKYPQVQRLSKKERNATPIQFRDLLISIARSVYDAR